jgi:hypothetical protein
MERSEFRAFGELLDNVYGLYGKEPTAGQKAVFFKALEGYPFGAVSAALSTHMQDAQRGRFAPLPADVVAQIDGMVEQHDGRPGAEEAWALVLRGQDEAETVVWTGEMAQAWDVARIVMPDEVGARMAFKEAYSRMTSEARRARLPAVWSVSLGHDPQRRQAAIGAAVIAGRLPASEMPPALPAPSAQPLLALEHAPSIPEGARAALRRLREKLARTQDAESLDAAEKARTQQLKDETDARVAARLAQAAPAAVAAQAA